ncbi:MAG: GNAT family N-acetyltransferase [Mycobacterium sp.]
MMNGVTLLRNERQWLEKNPGEAFDEGARPAVGYANEDYRTIAGELDALWRLDDTDLWESEAGLNPHRSRHAQLADHGMLHVETARLNGELIGYQTTALSWDAMHAGDLYGYILALHVLPASRGRYVGVSLCHRALSSLRKIGVKRVIAGSRVEAPSDVLFRRCGFLPVDMLYAKEL